MVIDTALRVVFFGTPAFAVPSLDALLASRHTVVGVVTQPDRPRGRGQQTTAAPVKDRAVSAGIALLQPLTMKDPAFLTALDSLGADIGVVAAYGKILTDAVLSTPRLGLVNVHASLLPAYRGAAPVHRAVMAGDRETGVTIMRVVKALDAGPMLAAVRHPISDADTSADVEHALAAVGADVLVDTLTRMAAGPIVETPQDDTAATYAPKITRDDGIVNWLRSAPQIHNQIRGLYPWPHAYTFAGHRRLILLRSTVVAADTHALPGTVVAAHADALRVATGDGILEIAELQAEGKRPMTARDFLAGHPLALGARLTSEP